MKVRPSCAGIAGMPDPGDHLSALDLLPFGKARRVSGQVSVIIHPFLVRGAFVDGETTARAVEELLDRPVGSGDDGRALGGHDVDGVMTSPSRARIVKGVLELVGLHSNDGKR